MSQPQCHVKMRNKNKKQVHSITSLWGHVGGQRSSLKAKQNQRILNIDPTTVQSVQKSDYQNAAGAQKS